MHERQDVHSVSYTELISKQSRLSLPGELLRVLSRAPPKFEAVHYNLRAAQLPSPSIVIKTTYSKATLLHLPAG